jgi:hypothetical protein
MVTRFVDVQVEEHADLPAGCSMRFRASGEAREVRRVKYESEDGVSGTWRVEAAQSDGTRAPATGVPVDDSGEGTATLIHGGDHGLRLVHEGSDATVAEPYLLLRADAVLG